MARTDMKETITLPEGVTATLKEKQVTITGPKGELTREFNLPGITVTVENNNIIIAVAQATKTQKNIIFTNRAHLRNMVKGVQEGYVYKLKICSGHFPMSVNVKGQALEIKNFIGEKVPRNLQLKEGANVKVDGDIIEVSSINKETAGQVAADIEKLTKRPGFDKRIFQDGIYIIEKAGTKM